MSGAAGPILAFSAVTLAGVGLYLVGGVRGPVEAAPNSVERSAGADQAHGAPILPSRTPLAAEPTAPSAAELFLEDYFGPEAAAVRAHLEDRGVDVNALMAPLPEEHLLALIPTWLVYEPTEREEMHRRRQDWPDELTSDWLTTRFGVLLDLPPEQLETIDFMAHQSRPEIEAAVDRYLDELELAMLTEFVDGRVETSPFVVWPPPSADQPPAASSGFYSLVRVGGGWVVRVGLQEQHHPGAIDARTEVAGLVRNRDDRIREALLALQ